MTDEYTFRTFNPSEGQSVNLPTDVDRSKITLGPPSASGRQALAVVIGSGEPEEYVVLSTSEDAVDPPDDSIILGVEVPENSHADATLFYGVPRSQFGGDD